MEIFAAVILGSTKKLTQFSVHERQRDDCSPFRIWDMGLIKLKFFCLTKKDLLFLGKRGRGLLRAFRDTHNSCQTGEEKLRPPSSSFFFF